MGTAMEELTVQLLYQEAVNNIQKHLRHNATGAQKVLHTINHTIHQLMQINQKEVQKCGPQHQGNKVSGRLKCNLNVQSD